MQIQLIRCILLELKKPSRDWIVKNSSKCIPAGLQRSLSSYFRTRFFIFGDGGGGGLKLTLLLYNQTCGYFKAPQCVWLSGESNLSSGESEDAFPPVFSQFACWATRGLSVPKHREGKGTNNKDGFRSCILRNTHNKIRLHSGTCYIIIENAFVLSIIFSL